MIHLALVVLNLRLNTNLNKIKTKTRLNPEQTLVTKVLHKDKVKQQDQLNSVDQQNKMIPIIQIIFR